MLIHCRPTAGQFTAAQFRSGLDDYKKKLIGLKDKFDRAMRVQVAFHVNELGEWNWMCVHDTD
jgi:hypothetical protein